MRLGIYGGTFSPPHRGHTEAARAFVEQLNLDKLLIIPTSLPPHKDFVEEAGEMCRLDMCKLAFSSILCAEVSDVEITRGGKSYTYMTLEHFADEKTELFFLCGTDMILTFDEWRRYEYIFSLATICYARRERDKEISGKIEEKIRQYQQIGAKIIRINHEAVEISSSLIRSDIKSGKDTPYLDAKVREYIEKRGLYR